MTAIPEDLFGLMKECGNSLKSRTGKRVSQSRILYVISEPGEMSRKELQETLQERPESINETLSKLEHKGFIEKIKDKEDKWRTVIKITEAGKVRLQEQSKAKSKGDPFAVLDEAQQEELKKILNLLLKDWRKDH